MRTALGVLVKNIQKNLQVVVDGGVVLLGREAGGHVLHKSLVVEMLLEDIITTATQILM